jgi:hypothetical protein
VQDVALHHGDCRAVVPLLPEDSADAVVTDPPYEFGFMGKGWDRTGVAFDPETWRAVLRVLKPAGYAVICGGSRTYHRLAVAVEDAGFEIRDCILWMYGTGFPKGKGCLKPAYEPILLARKPGPKVLPLGIDECRVGVEELTYGYGVPGAGRERACNLVDRGDGKTPDGRDLARAIKRHARYKAEGSMKTVAGRWPANVCHDGSDEVLEAFAAFGDRTARDGRANNRKGDKLGYGGTDRGGAALQPTVYGDIGTAARFFYCAKASRKERGEGNSHPTVKPLALVRWLVRLVCPPGGLCLDPFLGSGTTAVACLAEGRRCVGIEQEADYLDIARKRLAAAQEDAPLFADARD